MLFVVKECSKSLCSQILTRFLNLDPMNGLKIANNTLKAYELLMI